MSYQTYHTFCFIASNTPSFIRPSASLAMKLSLLRSLVTITWLTCRYFPKFQVILRSREYVRSISISCFSSYSILPRIMVRSSVINTLGPSWFRRLDFFRIKSVRFTRRSNFTMMVRGLFAWRFPGSRCATLMSFAV